MLKKRRVILFLAIVFSAILLSVKFVPWYSFNDQDYEGHIESQLERVIEEFDEDYIELLMQNRPNKQVSFSSLNIDTKHSFYLFTAAGNLIYWSDIAMIPEFQDFSVHKKYQLIENQKGVYFSKIRKLNRNSQDYWLLQVFTLYDNVDIQNDYLNTGHNKAVFGNERFILSSEKKEGYLDIHHKGEYLFSALFRVGYENASSDTNRTLLVFFFSLLGLILILGSDFTFAIWRKGERLLSLMYVFILLVIIRFMMIFFRFPQEYFETELFNPSQYASSLINPSLGDLLLNVISSLILLIMIISILSRKRFLIQFINFRKKIPLWILLLFAFIVSTSLMALFYILYINIVSNSQWTLNILAIPTFDYFKAISLFIVFLGGGGYLLFTIISLNLVLYKNSSGKKYALQVLLFFSVPVILALAYYEMSYLIAFLAHFILLIAIVSFELYNNIFRLGLNTFLTLFFGCLIGAVITGSAAYQDTRREEVKNKLKFANQILVEDDIMAEFLLSDIMTKISEDMFIKNRMSDPFLSKEPIEQKIRKIYLTNYFDQYGVAIKVFNKSGENIFPRDNSQNLDYYRYSYMKSDFATSVRNLYYIKGNEIGSGNRFYVFINLYREDAFLGSIVIELLQQRILASSVFPKLLMDRKYAANLNEENFDYAIYKDEILYNSTGVFNYRHPDVGDLFENSGLFTKGTVLHNYHHLGVRSNYDTIVVSSPIYPYNYMIADVSLFFVAYLVFTLFSIFIYSLFLGINRFQFNYTTKLQFYLNFAFFFPMLVISIIAVGFLSNSYTEDLHRQYFEKAGIIRDNLSKYLEDQASGTMEREDFYDEVFNLARTTNTDINIYRPSGKLMATNQPNIFEKKILTEFIHPTAFSEIIEAQNNRLILNEEVGNLNYKNVYLALRDKERQRLLGIISIPFFESETELNLLIADVFSNILNIFVFIFILFLVISFFVSKSLTYPFQLLTMKLKATNLENNESMVWPANDEIGLLVNEYNNMLFKLEASKKVLATTEKESAWREMAKQVAHEIKNPLTPMKLTLQHLLRLQALGKLEDPKMLKKPVETLINQVDTLSDIATSFSTFAKMPLPKNEVMDIREVVKEVVELFLSNERGDVHFSDKTTGELIIMGDNKLFGRVISNLIINGIQAVNSGARAKIQVNLVKEESKVKIEIKDNGKGIPEELREKIFVPNFSTKSEGSGLGLAIAKRGVEIAGGEIWFVTKMGKGTSFFLSFPLVN